MPGSPDHASGTIIQRGAEAVLRLGTDGSLYKERLRKGYRIPELDEEIRKTRTRKEVGLLARARRAGVRTPEATAVMTAVATQVQCPTMLPPPSSTIPARPSPGGVHGRCSRGLFVG